MATGAASKSGLSALYKIRFQNGLDWRGLEDSPFYLRVRRDTSFTERKKERTVSVTPGGSASPDFATALANRGPATQATFIIQTKPDYVVGSITNQVLKSRNASMIRDAFENELEAKGYVHGQTIQRKLWGYQGGTLGGCVTNGTTTVTVQTYSQAVQFYAGMVIEIATDDGSGTNPTGTVYGPYTIQSVDAAAKTFVTDSAVPTSATVTWYVMYQGEYGKNWSGLLGWCPPTDPSATPFLEVVRTAYGDLPRLSGFRPPRMLADHTRCVSEGLAYASHLGIKPNTIYCNPLDLDAWVAEIPNPQWVMKESTFANVNWEGLTIRTGTGTMTAVAEPKCPLGVWFATRMDLWTLLSEGEVPMKPGRGDLKLEATADAWQFRLISYCATDCSDPGGTVIGRFQTPA